MKFYAVLAAAALLLSAPLTVYADEEPAPEASEEEIEGSTADYEYTIDAEGNVTLDHFIPAESYEGELTIPSEIEGHPVTTLGKGCFMSCTGITAVTIPASVTDVGVHVFFDCDALTTFTVEEGNPYLYVENDVLFADDGKLLVAYPASKPDESYTIPDGVEEVTSGAFGFTRHLKDLSIPEGVQYLGRWTFGHSDTLETVDIPGSVILIEDYAFSYCTALNSVTFHSGTEEISHAAFAYDTALKQVTLPDTLKTVGQYAFCGTGLSCITIPPYVESISYCAFGYDGDMKAIHDFTIYGQPGTEAYMYAIAEDADNDYKNSFNFIAVEDACIPYELGGGKLYTEETEPAETDAADSDSSSVVTETDENGNPVKVEDKIGAGLFGNKRLQLILGIGGGVAIALAIVLLIAFAKKPKKNETEPEETADEEKAASEENSTEDAESVEKSDDETPAEPEKDEEA
ncbi:MAG: leucine-rich repeat protein [Oscillospiraceae bacterium]|nr:leucine-rich repeat protein [Oscillospiraceae bacterium]